MKIVFTVYTYYPMKDGVSSVTTYLAEGLAKKGHDVTVVTPVYGNEREEVHHEVKIKRVDIYNIHAIYRGNKVAYRKLIMELTADADVLVCVCTQTPTSEFLFPILHELQCKKILYMHGMNDFRWSRANFDSATTLAHKIWNNVIYGARYAINKKYFKEFDHIVQLYEEDYATWYFKEKYGSECDIIGNAADDVFFESISGSTVSEKYAICVSNYIERKNQEMLIRAVYQTKISELKLVLIGSEETQYFKVLGELNRELAEENGVNKVELLTNVSRDKTVEYIKNATVYLLGSKWEAFPISIVEAVASGVPYISTAVGCVASLPGGVIIKSETEMAEWIDTFMENEVLREKYVTEGLCYARENLTIESKVTQLEKLMQ